MANKFGPSKSDLKFQLVFSIAGLALMVFALIYRGMPTTPGGWEAIGLATVFFGATLTWTLRKLRNKDFPPDA